MSSFSFETPMVIPGLTPHAPPTHMARPSPSAHQVYFVDDKAPLGWTGLDWLVGNHA